MFFKQHFIEGKPTNEHPYPITADPSISKVHTARKPPKKRVSENLAHKSKKTKKDLASEDDIAAAQILIDLQNSTTTEFQDQDPSAPTDNQQETPVKVKLARHVKNKKKEPENVKGVRINCTNCQSAFIPNTRDIKDIRKKYFINEIEKSNENCMRYTGFPNIALLKGTFEWVKETASTIKLWDGQYKTDGARMEGRPRKSLTLYEEYLMTLVRIRRGYDIRHLAFLFGLSRSHVTRVFIAWVNLLHRCMDPLIHYPTKDLVEGNLPSTFRSYPRTRIIIDCTEFHVQKPTRPGAQKVTWSSYKHSNTLKLLVGIMPTGAITFRSSLYGGAISDVNIVRKSGLLDLIEEKDDIMADKGFTIRHLLLPKKATLNLPAFCHKGKSLSKKALTKSRNIARVRIHVERAISRLKSFRILSGVISIKLRYVLNQIITIASCLCNLQNRLA